MRKGQEKKSEKRAGCGCAGDHKCGGDCKCKKPRVTIDMESAVKAVDHLIKAQKELIKVCPDGAEIVQNLALVMLNEMEDIDAYPEMKAAVEAKKKAVGACKKSPHVNFLRELIRRK